ncbi:hypothetical protein LTS18_005606 [Coniosporium uncinatum]|uniref:Uncharacterized protein n=1 Tax=Coniosporium uncinatum TaxID=93489 RepID=A0ACC3DXK3_9PEZI|nr:hypothetical protein LTS18_005606 [Coniosporium uncinatum]
MPQGTDNSFKWKDKGLPGSCLHHLLSQYPSGRSSSKPQNQRSQSNDSVRTIVSPIPSPFTSPGLPCANAPNSSGIAYHGTPAVASTANPTQHHVLLVDDNAINLRLLTTYVKKLGASYATARDGHEAVEVYKATARPFSYVFMNVSMPVMDGFEATRRIRAFESESRIDRRDGVVAANRAGVDGAGKKRATIVALTGIGQYDRAEGGRESWNRRVLDGASADGQSEEVPC